MSDHSLSTEGREARHEPSLRVETKGHNTASLTKQAELTRELCTALRLGHVTDSRVSMIQRLNGYSRTPTTTGV